MFDIGFSELVVIGLVALIVIGPERLPRVARTVGHLVGRLQRYVADVKADINREVELEELRKMRDEVQQAASSIETSVTSATAEFSNTEEELKRSLALDALPEAPAEAATEAAPQASVAVASPPGESAQPADKLAETKSS